MTAASLERSRTGEGRTEWLIALATGVAAVLLLASLLLPMSAWATERALPWPVFAGAIVLAELANARIVIRAVPVSVRLAEIPIALGLFYLAPVDLVIAAMMGSALAVLIRRDRPPHRAAAELGIHALGCVGAVLVFRVVAERAPDGLAGDFASALAGVGVTVLAFAGADTMFRTTGRDAGLREFGRFVVLGIATATVNTAMALVAMSDGAGEPGELFLLGVPAVAGLIGYRTISSEQHRQARLRFLYDCSQLLDGPTIDEAVLSELMIRIHAMFSVRVAELLLGSRRGPATRVWVEKAHMGALVETAPGQLLTERRALLGPGQSPRTLGRRDPDLPDGWHQAMTTPLRGGSEVVGTITVADPRDVARRFRDEDRHLLETVGDRLALVLQNSDLIARLTASLDDVTKLAAIVQSSDDGIIALDERARIASWNPGAERLLGYPADTIVSQTAAAFVLEPDLETFNRHFAAAMDGSQLGEVRMELQRQDGTHVPVAISLSPVRSAAGEVVGAAAMLRDATDRVRAEQAASAGAAQLRTVIEASPLGMGACGPDHRWTEANPALCELLGLPSDALIGRPVTEMIHPDDMATVAAVEEGLFERGPDLRSVERRYVSHDGRVVWVRVATRLVRDSPSGVPFALYTIDDITERRRAEDEARSTEEQFRRATLAISGMQDPVRIARATLTAAREMLHAQVAAIVEFPAEAEADPGVEADGIDPETIRRLVAAGPAGAGALGLARRLGRPVRIRDVRSHPEFGAVLADSPHLGSLMALPLSVDLPGGSTMFVMNREGAEEFTAGDEAVGVALATHAAVCIENARVNERARRLVVELDQANLELTRANEAKSRFLGSVAHELRTPLHAILVAGELVHDPPSGSLRGDEIRRLGRTIETSSRHMVRLIDDLVDLARIEAGRVDLQMTQVDAGEVLGEITASLGPSAREKQVELDLPATPGLALVADPVRLRQILTNLVANAIKFTEAGGRVWAETSTTRASIRFTVHDTGPGIAPEDLERIFEPFEQGARTSQLGAGLGLAIARSLAELHGGRIEVTSTPGAGSEFSLVVPRRPSPRGLPRSASPAAGDPPLEGRGRLVLVVEDDPTALELVAEVLRKAEYLVREATDVDAAMRLLQRRRPDLVLLDVRLGDQSGLDLVPSIRERDGAGRIPVLALSADTSPEDVRHAAEAGCDAFLSKPVGPRLLLARIRSMIDDAEAVAPAS